MNIIKTSKSRFEELIKNPLFFIEKVDKSEYNEQGTLIENIYWRPTSSYIDAYIKLDKSENDATEYLLAIIEHEVNNSSEQEENKEQHKDYIEFSIHIANSKNIHDWIAIINSYIIRSKNTDDKFQYMHLVWFLNHIDWDVSQLKKVLECYDVNVWFPLIKELFRMERFCTTIGLSLEQTRILIKGKPIEYNGKLYSEEHKTSFTAAIATAQIVKEPTDKTKLTLSINGIIISEWFNQQYSNFRQSFQPTHPKGKCLKM